MNRPVEDVELDLLLEGVFQRYGYDFRNYARASVRRRVLGFVATEGLASISQLQDRVLREPTFFADFVEHLSVNVTSMFRDPQVFLAFRRKVVPLLQSYPFLRIWAAGCSTGEEVYSIAIVLHEEGLLDRTRLYATDISEQVVDHARRGIFDLKSMQKYIRLYHRAGGRSDFTDYYVADSRGAILRESLRERVVFSQHSLVTDQSFNEFNVIFCRNVLIYFDTILRDRVHRLLYGSLASSGVLVLGIKETIDYTPFAANFERVDEAARIYRRAR